MKDLTAIQNELTNLAKRKPKKKKFVKNLSAYIQREFKKSTLPEKIRICTKIDNKYLQSAFTISLIQTLNYPDDLELATELIKNCNYADVREVCAQHIRMQLFLKHMKEYDSFHNTTKEISVFPWHELNEPDLLKFELTYKIKSSVSFGKEDQFSTILEVPELNLAEERAQELQQKLIQNEQERSNDYKAIFPDAEPKFKIKPRFLQPLNNLHHIPFGSAKFKKGIDLEKEGVIISYPTGIEYYIISTHKHDYLKYEGAFYPCLTHLQVLLLKEKFDHSDEKYESYENGISEKLADKVDKILKKEDSTSFLKVDREKLKKSLESWVYLKIDHDEDIIGFGNTTGLLTW